MSNQHDFISLKQYNKSVTTGSAVSINIPTANTLPGLPAGQPVIMRICAKTDAIYKFTNPGDSADKTLDSNEAYSDGNTFAEKNAIETFKVVGTSFLATPQIVSLIADSADGKVRVAFGYYQ